MHKLTTSIFLLFYSTVCGNKQKQDGSNFTVCFILLFTTDKQQTRDIYNMLQLLLHSFNGLFSNTSWASQHQKTNPDLMEQEIVSGSGICWAICKFAPHSREITMPAPHHNFFTGWMPFLLPNHQRQSTEDKCYNMLQITSKCLQYFDTVGWLAGRASSL